MIETRHQNTGAQSKPFAQQESRTSLGSLVTNEDLKIQYFWGNCSKYDC